MTGVTTRVSTASDGTQGNNISYQSVRLSADGTKVFFASLASNLVANDTNGTWDIFMKDLVTGATTRISETASGTAANGESGFLNELPDLSFDVSADGGTVVFSSAASNIVSGDTNGSFDAFVRRLGPSGAEDTAIPLPLSAALVDTDGSETLQVRLSGLPLGSALSTGTAPQADGSFVLSPVQLSSLTFTPPENYNGTFMLTVSATATEGVNGASATTAKTVSVTVTPVNDAPVAVDDAVAAGEDGTTIIPPSQLLANDLDADGDSLVVLSVDAQGAQGAVSLVNGEIRYTAGAAFRDLSAGETGSDTFRYTSSDGKGGTTTGTVAVTIVGADDPLTVSGGISGVVEEEDGLAGGIEDAASLLAGQDRDSASDLGLTTNVVVGRFADVLTLSGLDGTAAYAFAAVEGAAAVKTGGAALTSGGRPVLYHVAGSTLIGYADQGGVGYAAGTDRPVFTLELGQPAAGQFRFTLLDRLDHHATGAADQAEGSIGIDLGGVVVVTDVGDTNPADTAAIGNFSLSVIDDVPVAQTIGAEVDIVLDALSVQNVVAGWTNVTPKTVVTSDTDGDGVPDQLRWGEPASGTVQSGYGFVDNSVSALSNLRTNDAFSLGTFTHYNQPVYADGSTLTSATLSTGFTVLVNGVSVPVAPIKIDFTHTETPNTGTPEQQRDIISIATTTTTVNIAGQNYTLDVLGLVDPAGNIVSTVYTNEGENNPFSLAVRFVSSDAGGLKTSGDVLTQTGGSAYSAGADGGSIAGIGFGATSDTTADANGHYVLAGAYGSLEMGVDGSFIYKVTRDGADVPHGTVETFSYTVRDGDGDRASSTLSIALDVADAPINLVGTAAGESLVGGAGREVIRGLGGNDVVNAGGGNDFLVGGLGADSLTGGLGGDIFIYNAVAESTAALHDTITDVTSADRFDFSALSGLGNGVVVQPNAASSLVFDHAVTWFEQGGETIVVAEATGDGVADLEVHLSGIGLGLTGGNFLL